MMLTRTGKDKLRCLPQYLLGLIIRLVLKAKLEATWNGRRVYRFVKGKFFSGTALFDTYLPHDAGIKTTAHEHGHHCQGDEEGWLYLPVIGVASLRNNLKARKCVRTWENYYRLFPEEDADELGGVRWENGVRVYP